MIFQATCKLGLEALAAAELRALGISVLSVEDARVRFEGDESAMARACLWLRTAERVLLEVGSFPAATFDALFEGVKALSWKPFLARDAFIHVVGKSAKSTLFSVSDCQSIVKKAVVEKLRESYRCTTIPETGGPERPFGLQPDPGADLSIQRCDPGQKGSGVGFSGEPPFPDPPAHLPETQPVERFVLVRLAFHFLLASISILHNTCSCNGSIGSPSFRNPNFPAIKTDC